MSSQNNVWDQDNLDGLELLFSKNFMEENKQREQQIAANNSASQVLVIEPQFSGAIQISVNTQIQTNRRTNFYLDAEWPAQLLQKKMPIFYYPPVNENIYEQCAKIDTPTRLWLSEMGHFYYGTSSYVEVQLWMKNPDGKMQLIPKCRSHSSLIKLPGQPYEDKALSHEEVKWKRNTMVFGVNFNCTRSCFKSEIYMFIRIRLGHMYWESSLLELPFRRSEKRKQEQVGGFYDFSAASKKQLLTSEFIPQPVLSQPTQNSLLGQISQRSYVEEQLELQRRIIAQLQAMQQENASTYQQPKPTSQNLPILFASTMQEIWTLNASGQSNTTNSTSSNSTETQWFPDSNLPTVDFL